MQYVADPKSGNNLSVLGFGCMRFPRDKEKTEQLIVTAVDAGVNYFDTAYIYGSSEAALGEILYKNSIREKVYIATKLPQHIEIPQSLAAVKKRMEPFWFGPAIRLLQKFSS